MEEAPAPTLLAETGASCRVGPVLDETRHPEEQAANPRGLTSDEGGALLGGIPVHPVESLPPTLVGVVQFHAVAGLAGLTGIGIAERAVEVFNLE
jgi:hypothetical protein